MTNTSFEELINLLREMRGNDRSLEMAELERDFWAANAEMLEDCMKVLVRDSIHDLVANDIQQVLNDIRAHVRRLTQTDVSKYWQAHHRTRREVDAILGEPTPKHTCDEKITSIRDGENVQN
jgi:hypothetical protein